MSSDRNKIKLAYSFGLLEKSIQFQLFFVINRSRDNNCKNRCEIVNHFIGNFSVQFRAK